MALRNFVVMDRKLIVGLDISIERKTNDFAGGVEYASSFVLWPFVNF
jgi:orotidine-5'-phosphate decarboxylase